MQQVEPSRFGFESTADDVLAEIDLSGKAAVVTGDSGGLGAESARALAARGAAVVLTADGGNRTRVRYRHGITV